MVASHAQTGRSSSPAGGRSRAGFTLLELVLALVIVGVLAAVAVSRRSPLNADAFADAQILKGALRAVRTRAMADIVPWSFTVAGQTGTLARNGVARETVAFTTTGVSAGAITFDNRGRPAGTMSFTVADFANNPITVTTGTGYVP